MTETSYIRGDRCLYPVVSVSLLMILLWISGCHSSDQGVNKPWTSPVRFVLRLPDSGVSLYRSPALLQDSRFTVLPEDEENETYTVDVLGIGEKNALVGIQGDTGWVRQQELWVNRLYGVIVYDDTGAVLGGFALPYNSDEVSLSISDGLVEVDNGEWILTVRLSDFGFCDSQRRSSRPEVMKWLKALDIVASASRRLGDTLWVYDAFRNAIIAVSLDAGIILCSVDISDLPEGATVTGLEKIGRRAFLWGLEYEFGECPLLAVPLNSCQGRAAAKQLTQTGGLLAKTGPDSFIFFEKSGQVYTGTSIELELRPVTRPRIDPLLLNDLVYMVGDIGYLGVLYSDY